MEVEVPIWAKEILRGRVTLVCMVNVSQFFFLMRTTCKELTAQQTRRRTSVDDPEAEMDMEELDRA